MRTRSPADRARDLGKRLGRCLHLDDTPILEEQPVALAERGRLGQVEQELDAARPLHRDAPAMALIEVEDDRVGRHMRPLGGGKDAGGADHAPGASG